MSGKEYLRRLFAYHYWANHRVWEAIMKLSEAQFAQAMGDTSMRGLCHQIISEEKFWFAYLLNETVVTIVSDSEYQTRAELHDVWERLRHDVLNYVKVMSREDLDRTLTHPFNREHSLKAWEILLNVIEHGMTQRTKIIEVIRQMDGKTEDISFIRFVFQSISKE